MGKTQSTDKKQRILIIGASFSGIYLYQSLSSQFDIHIVDTKDFFEYTPGIHFALISGRSYDGMCVKYEDSIIADHFIFGKVTELRTNSAVIKTLTDSITLDFDFCVICTGSKYSSPTKAAYELTTLAQRKEQVLATREEIARAKTVLVKGGGFVGVEIAAEFAHIRKNVVLSVKEGRILHVLNKKAQDKAKAHLKRVGVTIVDCDRVTKEEEEASSKYDMVYDCTGYTYPTEDNILNKHFRECRDEKGRVRVNQYMQICDEKHAAPVSHIFAIGDGCITQADEIKVVLAVRMGGAVAVSNIKQLASKKAGSSLKLKEFPKDKKKIPEIAVVSMGNKSMFVIFGFVLMAGIITYFKFLFEYINVSGVKSSKNKKKNAKKVKA